MIRKKIHILILLLAIIIADVSAQNSQVLYYMNLPQNHILNPALRPSGSVYIGLPVLSGINVIMNNNFLNFSDLFIKGQASGDSIMSFLHPDYDVDKFLASIKDKNSLVMETEIQLFGLGLSVGKDGYIFLDINDRIEGNIALPGDLFRLGLKGNGEFIGKKIDLSTLGGNVKYYREAGLGYSRNFTNKLRIGVKAKMLFGIAGASINNRALGLTVNDDYSHTLNADLMVNISGPVSIRKDAENNIDSIWIDKTRFNSSGKKTDFLLNSKNIGLGIDIGAEYKVTDKIFVSAAVTDIGFIKWKTDILNIRAEDQFEFSGLNIVNVVNGTMSFDSLANQMLDSLKNSLVVSDTKAPFTTYLPVGISLSGSYNVTDKFSVGVLSYTRIIDKKFSEALTLSANLNLNNMLSASIAYTAANNRYDNLGAGLAFRAGIFQFYMLADRIPLMWNKIKSDNSTIPLPANLNTINLRLGMNLVFGNRSKKKDDKPMVRVE